MRQSAPKPRLLFVCARNKWRSPTAERIFRGDPRIEVRSAGLSPASRHQVSSDDLAWADLILVMEHGQKTRLQSLFKDFDSFPGIEVLDIPDDYEFMDAELIDLITGQVELLLPRLCGQD